MEIGRTLPQDVSSQPIRSLHVRVASGPDAGAELEGPEGSLSVGTAPGNDLVLRDETVSGHHLELINDGERVRVVDHESTNGTYVGPARIRQAWIPPGTLVKLGRTSVEVLDGRPVEVELYPGEDLHGLKGRATSMRRLMRRLEKVAKSDASVLLLGETGVGKEVVAQALHRASPRANRPLEIVDCGALMPTLVASELFGHEKGAFTGANQRHVGAFERANGGTIFLDEIGELTQELQVRLLGVLERRRFRRVGGTDPIEVDVRVVAATHRDLRNWVNTGEFRQDLYYRLAVARLEIPALRDRVEDIPLLAEHFLQSMGYEGPVESHLSSSVLTTLAAYHWPGNVRELRNFVESAVAFGEPPPIEAADSEAPDVAGAGFMSVSDDALCNLPYKDARDQVLFDFQKLYFSRMMEQTQGNVSHAATVAKMSRPALIQILKRIGLK